MNEEWRDIPGFEGSYQASSLGRIRSLDRIGGGPASGQMRLRGRLLSIRKRNGKDRAVTVTLHKNGQPTIRSPWTWVWMAFHGAVPEGKCVVHANGDINDHAIANLKLLSESQVGQHFGARSSGCYRSKR